MLQYIVRRVLGAAFVLVALSITVFFIFVVLPGGDPAERMAGKNATQAGIESIRQTWGFDRPVPVQYVKLMGRMLDGSLVSYTSQQNVAKQILQGMPATFSLTIGAAVLWLTLSILVGTFAALRAGGFSDATVTALALVGISLPPFWLGVVMRYVLAERHSLVPDGEYVALTTSPLAWASHLWVPWLVLAFGYIGFYARVLRGNTLETLHEDFVRTAKAKGISWPRVVARHVLRTSLLPIVTLFGLDFAAVLGGGAIVTESVFDLHGVGQYAAQSINNLDMPPIMGVTLYGGAFIVIFSVAIDFAHAWFDPRVRLTRSG